MELNLRFPDEAHVEVQLDSGEPSGALEFANPLKAKDLADIRWYVETYGAHSLSGEDDSEAARVAGQLPIWGSQLFASVFSERKAERLVNRFQDREEEMRLLTISAQHSAILALPWELLHDSVANGTYLFNENPRVSIRRRIAGATEGRAPFSIEAKETLHLLFVVSRPKKAGFINPRLDPEAVMDALDEHAPGRVRCEFLRPPTYDALVERLRDRKKPHVDILHFDGHGIFDTKGDLPRRVKQAETPSLHALQGILLRAKKGEDDGNSDQQPNTGYLLFQDAEGDSRFVSAHELADDLYRQKVGLVILSACQSAAYGDEQSDSDDDRQEEEAQEAVQEQTMGSVAASLTATGIPAVLAMSYSVLVHTTAALFGQFYKNLGQNQSIGEALDNARSHLKRNPEKYEVQRGDQREMLKLHDWFLPALYESGADAALLKEAEDGAALVQDVAPDWRQRGGALEGDRPDGRLVQRHEAGFFGRTRQLWDIERWLAGETRRISITGFGGQGKTELAQEAGRWLTRTGLFQGAVFVDYARYQGRDAVHYAVTCIGSVLDESPADADAATQVLGQTPTLVILDNLEALIARDEEGTEATTALQALLAAAVAWSEAGDSRLLLTSRRPDFNHPRYPIDNSNQHRRIQLDGLGNRQYPDDALDWFAALSKLGNAPTVARAPEREGLINLFDAVRFHPLSIRVLAQQLKSRGLAEVGQRLAELLQAEEDGVPVAEDTPAELLASLKLSLDRLSEEGRALLPRLGVFQGGAFEDDLLAITEIAEEAWRALRRQLEDAALIEAEALPGIDVPFLRFHPTLQPLLWAGLDAAEQERLGLAHRRRYYALANYLYGEDRRHPHQARAIARRELPNLLHAVHAAFAAADPDAVNFADRVNWFLGYFGLRQEAARLTEKARDTADEVGSQQWYVAQSNRGEQLLAERRVAEAARVFEEILEEILEAPSYERVVTLHRLGRCFTDSGQPGQAERHYRDALEVLDGLEPSDSVKRQRGGVWTDLADVLRHQGRYAEARKAYETGLEPIRELKDLRSQGVILGQLGTLAMAEGKLDEAERRYREALALFQQLGEPAAEAVAWHQLGRAFQEAGQWDEAERHYRESGRISEAQGNIAGAAQTWNSLALICEQAGKSTAAEAWYGKAIEGFREIGDLISPSKCLSNLADLLQDQPGRLAEARNLAEEALAIKQTLDPGAAEIWKIYNILAEIADKEAAVASNADRQAELQTQARDYRRQARDARAAFAGTQHELQPHLPLIRAVVETVGDQEKETELEQVLLQLEQNGWNNLVAAIRRVIGGERAADALFEGLDSQDSTILETILRALDDPTVLTELETGPNSDASPAAPAAASTAPAQMEQLAAVLAALPPAVRQAIEAGDAGKLQAALAALPQEEAAAIAKFLAQLTGHTDQQ